MPFRPCFIKINGKYIVRKKNICLQRFPLAGSSSGSGFPLHLCSRRNVAERKNSLSFSLPFLLLSQEEKTERKTFPPFLFLFSIFSRSGRNGSILDFSPLSSLSFQKKRRRKGVEEGEVFSLSFLSFFFLSLFFFRRKRREEELLFPSLFLPLGEEFFSHSFSFFLSFLRRKGERKNSFFSSLLGERKMGEKEGEKRKE